MWQVLGIEATDDPSAIRRAYAARLKSLDPDRDPDAFKTLRQAYESALARAERRRSTSKKPERAHHTAEEDGDAGSESERDPTTQTNVVVHARPGPDPLLADAEAESKAALQKFRRALAQREWLDAAAELVSASARGLLPLTQEEDLAAEVIGGAIADREFPSGDFAVLAIRLQWDAPLPWNRGPHDALRQQVRGRLDADAWYHVIAEQASYRPKPGLNLHARLWGDPKQIARTAAAMILGQAPHANALLFKKWLDPLVDQAERHQQHLPGRIDPTVVAAIRTTLGSAKPVVAVSKRKNARRYWLWIFLGVLLIHFLIALVRS
jgi:hypothetical protein